MAFEILIGTFLGLFLGFLGLIVVYLAKVKSKVILVAYISVLITRTLLLSLCLAK